MAATEHSFLTLREAGLDDVDPAVADLIRRETDRQRDGLELIASENFTWPSVMEAVGSVLTNKYAEGYPGRRYYGGCEVVDEVEQLAIDRAKALFGPSTRTCSRTRARRPTWRSTWRCSSRATRSSGCGSTRADTSRTATRSTTPASSTASTPTASTRHGAGRLDEVRSLAHEHRPKLIVAGGSAYPRQVEVAQFREIADEVGALLMVDMAHFAGLVAAGEHPNPVELADVVTSTTHKTLAGPRSGLILCREELAKKIDAGIFPGLQGGPLCHATAAKAVCFRIAASEGFREYQRQVRRNATRWPTRCSPAATVWSPAGPDTHLVLLNLSGTPGPDGRPRTVWPRSA
jgi:glycine hydroxymethyltransferase